MNQYKKLKVWQASTNPATSIYETTKTFPAEERFGLTSQIRRASVSISANIAEGAGRNNRKEFRHFIGIALGSACQLETLLTIANNTNILRLDEFSKAEKEIINIQNMLFKLKQSITKQPNT